MKKTAISLALVLAMALAMVMVSVPVAEATDTTHVAHTEGMNHCACGGTAVGVGDHTTCTSLTGAWVDLNNYVTTTGTSLAAGNYYLSANLNLADVNALVLNTEAVVTICLNGYNITNPNNANEDTARCFWVKAGFANGTLNICDCQGGGEIHSEGQKQGAVLHAVNNSALNSTINLYSGTIIGSPNTTQAGGSVRICKGICNIYAATIKDGKNVSTGVGYIWGGNLMISNTGKVNMYGGVIKNGTAAEKGSNVYVASNCEFNVYGGSIIDGNGAANIEAANGGKIKIVNLDASTTVQLNGSATLDLTGMDSSVTETHDATFKYTLTKAVPSVPSTPSTPSNPSTGDSANLVVMGLGLVLGVVGMACLLPKKQNV